MYMQALVLCCVAIVHSSFCFDKMDSTDNPIFEYLEMDPNSVVEHELVKINLSERLHKRGLRDGRAMNFQAFGINIDLWLRPVKSTIASDATPVYKVESSKREPHGVKYTIIPNAMKEVSQILADPKHLASVILDTDDSGRRTVTGYLQSQHDNSRLVIRSLPANVVKGYLRKRRSIEDLNDHSMDSMHHVVFKLKNNDLQHHSLGNFSHASIVNSRDWQKGKLSDYENINYKKLPNTVYPEILVEMDATYHKNSLKEQLKYILVFWNTVDLLYRQVPMPMFRFNIAGIIIAKSLSAMPFIAASMDKKPNFVDWQKALTDSAEFHDSIADIFPLNSYDIAVTMTKYYMGRSFEHQTLGVSGFHGACKYSRVALFHDDEAFGNILTATHELGHLFGLPDEIKRPPPGECSSDNGYIMAGSTKASTTSSIFSRCSLDAFKLNHEAGNYSCMYTKPKLAGKQWVIPLPGNSKTTVADLCLAFNGQPPCDSWNTDICVKFHCQDAKIRGRCVGPNFGVPPGTSCVNKQKEPGVCVANQCIPLD